MSYDDEVFKVISRSVKYLEVNKIGDDAGWMQASIKSERLIKFQSQVNLLLEIIRKIPVRSILDVGSAPFIVPLALKEILGDKFSVNSLDIDPIRFNNINNLPIKVIKCDIEKELISTFQKYDLIVLSHVFEHLRLDLIYSAENIKDALNKGGYLYIETPNLLSIRGWIKLLRSRTSGAYTTSLYSEWYKLKRFGHMGHVREYTEVEILHFFNAVGFEPIKIYYLDCIESSGIKSMLLRLIQKIFPKMRENFGILLKKSD